MFDDPKFDKYDYKDIPLDRDCYLVDEEYAADYESMYLVPERKPIDFIAQSFG